MNKRIIYFLVYILSFLIHLWTRSIAANSLFGDKIVLAYLINGLLAVASLWLLNKMLKKNSTSIGYTFLHLSMFKILIFFILFYTSYLRDDTIELAEFFAFFIPYAMSLTIEIIIMAKQLSRKT